MGTEVSGSRIRVVIVDDDQLTRRALVDVLATGEEIEVVGQADDGDELVDLVRSSRAHVALVDVRMARMNGVDATAQLAKACPECRVVVLTSFHTDDTVFEAVGAGASAFALKADAPTSLAAIIRDVAAGHARLDPADTRRVVDHVAQREARRTRARATLVPLSEREREVAVGVGLGLTNAEIGERLHCSESTVKTHLGHAFTKLGFTNRVRLALVVHEAELDASAQAVFG